MSTIPRISLVVFLVLLQLLAPLVHAHTHAGSPVFSGFEAGAAKLHVPGLETLNVHYDYSVGQGLKATLDVPPEGMVVGVNAGIMQAQPDSLADCDFACYCTQTKPKIGFFRVIGILPFPPPPFIFAYQLARSAHAPRAPPLSLLLA
jgi:hypothetical protein